ncbi:MAG: hypothetical protein KBA26_09155 [Candidatus Delongbacteria bacterium]|nr:hypothetical protein [Candidatus Delongbacteria bacterium]
MNSKFYLIGGWIVLWCIVTTGTILAQKDLVGDIQNTKKGIMDGNLVRTLFRNHGEVALWPDQPSGEWPKGSGHSYVDGVALAVSVSTYDRNGKLIHPLETNYREFVKLSPDKTRVYGWAPLPGYANPIQDEPAMSDNATTWPSCWPDKRDETDDPGWCGKWNGFFGKGIRNADLETFYVMDDDPDEFYADFYPDATDVSRRGIGLEVRVRGFQWSHVLSEDCIFWLYEIKNEGTTCYDSTYFAQYIDWGVGGTDDSSDDGGAYDTRLDIAYAYDGDGFGSPNRWSPVGVAGYGFLESPGNSVNQKDDDEDGIVDESRSDGIDNDGDWEAFSDLNGNGVWDVTEPLNDDLGRDGIGPLDDDYTGSDQGEGDGLPTPGEPDFDQTDPDESDQIGLTGFNIFSVHYYELIDDDQNWNVFKQAVPPGSGENVLNGVNLGMFFASGSFPLAADQTERFSMALLFGEDRDDLVRNKKTVQQIYDADYRFAQPPKKPTVRAVPGDGKVTLYWDSEAETSYDRFLGQNDFEGYAIYKSTDANFLESRVITDSYGNLTFRKALARFDKVDGRYGPHPIDINGIKYDLGTDSGLRHSYIDTDVQNGQVYYYAIVSYDYGLIDTSVTGEIDGITPTECTSIIKGDVFGEMEFDLNTVMVTPRAPAAGYIKPSLNDIRFFGVATGTMEMEIIDPDSLPDQHTYRLVFSETSAYHDAARPMVSLIDQTLQKTLFEEQLWVYGQEMPIVNGLAIHLYNDSSVRLIDSLSGWQASRSDYLLQIEPSILYTKRQVTYPADYRIYFCDQRVGRSLPISFGQKEIPTHFWIKNLTENDTARFNFMDYDNDSLFTPGDVIVILGRDSLGQGPDDKNYIAAYSITAKVDTIHQFIEPVAGDSISISVTKPFRNLESFEFNVKGPDSDLGRAKSDLDKIAVVPNPYVGSASWEAANPYSFGRGERKIEFIHLPARCTIRIYTLRGFLVTTLEHQAAVTDGSESWNLTNKEGMDVAYGLYLFQVDAEGVGTKIGKFAIIK